MSIRIVLVDDHGIVRDGMSLVLRRESDLAVVGEAADEAAAWEVVRRLLPDLVVMDINLGGGNGLAVTKKIRSELPQVRVLIVSAEGEASAVRAALEAGAGGFLRKEQAADELAKAIRLVQAGQVYLCSKSATALAAALTQTPGSDAAPEPTLSPRERQVLKMVAEGWRNKEIADELRVGVKSVETYRSRLMKKLQCESPAELVRYAVRAGIARL